MKTDRYTFSFIVLFLFLFEIYVIRCIDLKAFDDTVLFKLNWPGGAEIPELHHAESMVISTQSKEKYKCLLPEIHEKTKNEVELYTGPNPLQLLMPLFLQTSCSYRIESYWTYEVCHGRYVRQYHEEREGKKVKLQEFFLGRWEKTMTAELNEELEQVDENGEKKFNSQELPVKKIDGLNLPYFQINMTDGTLCDLSEKPRVTRVLYVCYQNGKHDIYSFKETSICEYETIVLSPLLCNHPKYRPHASSENIINCHPLEDSPKKPRSLLQLEAESLKLRHTKIPDDALKKTYAVFSLDVGQDGDQHVHVEILPVEVLDTEDTISSPVLNTRAPSDTTPAQEFLSGRKCLTGGSSSWWKYEFCYGRYVEQYHIDAKDNSKTTVQLGFFNEERHIEWLKQNPNKMQRAVGLKQVSHFYSGGTPCDKTGRPRHTEVKLKCPDQSASPGSVALYLMEPKTCEYILSVESQLICDLLPHADEHGLIRVPKSDDDEVTVSDEEEEPVPGDAAVGPDDRTAAEKRKTVNNVDPLARAGNA